MTVKEVLTKTIGIICDEDIDLDVDSKKRKRLVDCLDTVYQELMEQYIELKTKEEINVNDGKIYYTAFSKRLKDIISIHKNGMKQDYKLYPAYLEIDQIGGVEIRYTYLPEQIGIGDELILPPPYTENMLAMGIASEYFYRSGLIDEAIFYKNRYDNALVNLSRVRNSFTLKTRSFV